MRKRNFEPDSDLAWRSPWCHCRQQRRALALAAGVLLALARPAGAAVEAAAAPPAALPSAQQIVERNAQVRGGLEAWRGLRSLGEKGHIEHGQIKGPRARHGAPASKHGALDQAVPFTLELKRPHKMRLEMNLGDTTALQLFDGNQGWTVQPSPKGPVVRAFSAAEAAAAAEQVDPEGPLIDAAAKGNAVALEGEDTVEGHRAYKLALTLKNGQLRHIWLDAQTYLDLKIDGSRIIEGRSWPVETYFYDWKTVSGLRLPYRIETAVNDVRTSSRIVVERALINPPLPDEKFALPAPAATTGAPRP